MGDAGEDFSVEDAVKVQRELRRALGLGAETFPLAAFVGMISDEIEQFRSAGRSDAEIVEVVRSVTGREVEAVEIARFYAPPEMRRQPGG